MLTRLPDMHRLHRLPGAEDHHLNLSLKVCFELLLAGPPAGEGNRLVPDMRLLHQLPTTQGHSSNTCCVWCRPTARKR